MSVTAKELNLIHLPRHSKKLDAHHKSFYTQMRIGSYYHVGGRRGTLTLAANQLYGFIIAITREMTIDRMAIDVETNSVGHSARLGIYECNDDLEPENLILDAGEISVNAVAIVAAVINQQLNRGLYYIAILSDGIPHIEADYGDDSVFPVLGVYQTDFRYNFCGYAVAQAYGALPDPFTGGGALSILNRGRIALRIASLD